jgi:hypothetical protein
MLNDEQMWALGQHFGLATPLLDWSVSPYVALFFAFSEDEKNTEVQAQGRALFGLKRNIVEREVKREQSSRANLRPSIEFLRPAIDENMRLISQGGLFSRAAPGVNIEDWVESIEWSNPSTVVLYKVVIPEVLRDEILVALNRMNINHLSLFPDIQGAAAFTNLGSQVPKYGG